MNDLFSLEGKYAVVSGGAGGMGRGIAEGLITYGADVALADISAEGLERAARELEAATGKKVRTYAVNLTEESDVQRVVDEHVAAVGRVDILVNAQGINVKAPATEFPMDGWDKLFQVNVKSVMLCCKLFGAQMCKQGGGKIVSLSSVRGVRGTLGGNTGYCATKGAIDAMTRNLACELAPPNVCVNALGPIITITPMTEERIKNEAARYERMLQNVPMGRMAKVSDLIGPVVFLVSAASDFVTGTVLYPDGGMLAYS